MGLSRDQIEKRGRPKVESVRVDSLRADSDKETPVVFIRELEGLERDTWASSMRGKDGELDPTSRCRLVMYTLCDSEGKRFYSDDEFDHVARLSAAIVDEVAEASLRFNKLAAEDVEDELGNSESGPSGNSGSN